MKKTLDSDKNRQLYFKLRHDICSGSYLSGHQFPPEVAFARQLGVSRNTLRSALQSLEDEQLIVRLRSRGTFVREEKMDTNRSRVLYWGSSPVKYIPFTEHINPQFLHGIQRAARGTEFEIDICSANWFESMTPEVISRCFRERNVHGVIWQAGNFIGNEKLLKLLVAVRVPAVLLYCQAQDPGVTGLAAVPQSTQAVWIEALKYLKECGHRHIMTMTLNEELIRHTFTPEEYANLLQSMDFDSRPELVVRAEPDEMSIRHAVQHHFEAGGKATAILCYSDFWAPAIYRALAHLHLRVPQDVAVMGCFGSPNSEYMTPALSSVAIDYVEAGAAAMRLMEQSDSWFGSGNVPVIPAPFKLHERMSAERMNK